LAKNVVKLHRQVARKTAIQNHTKKKGRGDIAQSGPIGILMLINGPYRRSEWLHQRRNVELCDKRPSPVSLQKDVISEITAKFL
jgi:hypothetical protein